MSSEVAASPALSNHWTLVPFFFTSFSVLPEHNIVSLALHSSSQHHQSTDFLAKMPNFYTYQNPYPSQLATPGQGHWENPADWPKTYIYVANQDGTQGIHPPGPVYTANPPAQSNMYYYPVSESPILAMSTTTDHSLPGRSWYTWWICCQRSVLSYCSTCSRSSRYWLALLHLLLHSCCPCFDHSFGFHWLAVCVLTLLHSTTSISSPRRYSMDSQRRRRSSRRRHCRQHCSCPDTKCTVLFRWIQCRRDSSSERCPSSQSLPSCRLSSSSSTNSDRPIQAWHWPTILVQGSRW